MQDQEIQTETESQKVLSPRQRNQYEVQSSLNSKIAELQRAVDDYKVKNEDLNLDVENLNNDNFKMEQKIDILLDKIKKQEQKSVDSSPNDEIILKKQKDLEALLLNNKKGDEEKQKQITAITNQNQQF